MMFTPFQGWGCGELDVLLGLGGFIHFFLTHVLNINLSKIPNGVLNVFSFCPPCVSKILLYMLGDNVCYVILIVLMHCHVVSYCSTFAQSHSLSTKLI